MKKRNSICGRYTCYWLDHQSNAFVKDNQTGIIYDEGPKENNGVFYARSHMMTGYSAYGDSNIVDKSNDHFTLYFADCKKGVRIKPWSGNTIVKKHEAIFRAPKY